jgi:predicted ATPase
MFALLKAAPRRLPEPIKEMGGVREWLWKGGNGPMAEATIEVVLENLGRAMDLRHTLTVGEHGGRFEVIDERIENATSYEGKTDPFFYYRFQRGKPVLVDFADARRELRRENIRPEESILSQVRDPERYPVLSYIQDQYSDIRLFRNWAFGPAALLRREQSTHGRGDFLEDGGENLTLVLSKVAVHAKGELVESLRELYDGIIDLHFVIDGGMVQLFLEEAGKRQIPATRLSDGTLRYLCLLAILLHPEPPPLVVIEEPELGLHPDIVPYLAQLMRRASERTQLVITTHSQLLVNAFMESPEVIVVCERPDAETRFERLDAGRLSGWLGRYTLGQLWSMGEIGGNRW